MNIDRRDFLKLFGMGSAVLVLGHRGAIGASEMTVGRDDFVFFQLSDAHWGFSDPHVNPDATGTLKKAIAAVNSMKLQPDFIVFTGDLTHTTDDPKERRKRMGEARDIISGLKVRNIRFLAGEHDAGLDNGEAFQEYFGKTHYTFDHKGVHFIVLDNVSDPTSSITDPQLQWLGEELKKLDKDARIIVLTHRPLFSLYPNWDWWTRDGAKAIDLLMPYKNVTVFYGHIHQEHHFMTDHIPHHAAKGLMFPLPAPGSLPKRTPIPWDASAPYKGLGYRSIASVITKTDYTITEYSIQKG
jgi:3',5'-cyclic AMP phosphodiesterase CpdA